MSGQAAEKGAGDIEGADPTFGRARARAGSVLREKWRLDVLLGVGGMAAVYAATHRNGSRVAIKVLHAELSVNRDVRARFLREGYVANAVGHDGAVKVTDDDTAEDGSAFLVMELLEGETLEHRRERCGKLAEDEVLSLTDKLLDVLAAAHAKGIIHRDLKPENVFVTRDGRVKVLDYGIARMRDLSTASTATRAGSTMGTPYYMAPEQARGLWDEVDGRTDLWAVGATMYQLLTGDFVHNGRTTNEVLLAAMTARAAPLASVAPGVSTAVAAVVDRALAFDRDNRWHDAAQMQDAVRQAYREKNQVPIAAAPKLSVPPTVPDRTLPATAVEIPAGTPTTAQPVVEGEAQARTAKPGGRSRTLVVGLGLAGAVVFGAVVTVALLSGTRHESSSASSPPPSAEAIPSASPPSPVAQAPSAPVAAPPVVAATDLPTATTPPAAPVTPPAPKPAAPAVAAPPAPVPAAPAKPNCSPPYTIDPATGKKHFKAECL